MENSNISNGKLDLKHQAA